MLKTPIWEEVKPVKKVLSMQPSGVSRVKEWTHLCIECLEEVKALGNKANQDSWNHVLCKMTNTSNADNHLSKKHSDSVKVKAYFEQKKGNKESVGALHSGSSESALIYSHWYNISTSCTNLVLCTQLSTSSQTRARRKRKLCENTTRADS